MSGEDTRQEESIVHGSKLSPKSTNSFQLPYYLWFELQLIKSSLIMPLIRKMESNRWNVNLKPLQWLHAILNINQQHPKTASSAAENT